MVDHDKVWISLHQVFWEKPRPWLHNVTHGNTAVRIQTPGLPQILLLWCYRSFLWYLSRAELKDLKSAVHFYFPRWHLPEGILYSHGGLHLRACTVFPLEGRGSEVAYFWQYATIVAQACFSSTCHRKIQYSLRRHTYLVPSLILLLEI